MARTLLTYSVTVTVDDDDEVDPVELEDEIRELMGEVRGSVISIPTVEFCEEFEVFEEE